MNPQVIVAPTAYPVSLAEARLQLGIDTEDYDPRLAALIAAATAHVENATGRALIQRTYRAFLDWWPSDNLDANPGTMPFPRAADWWEGGYLSSYVHLPMPPLVSIGDLITYDDSDVPTTFDPALYFADTAGAIGRLVLRSNAAWPIVLRPVNGIQIDWTAGYGPDPGDVPETMRLAILCMVGFLNEQRGDTDMGATPSVVDMLLSPYLVWPPA